MKKKLQKKWIFIFLQIIITFVFLYLTFRNTEIESLKSALSTANYWLLALGLIPQLIAFFLLAAREKFLLNKLYHFRFRDLFEGVIIGYVGNNILPLRGGEFLKVLYWSKKSSKSYISLLSVALIERLLDLICLILLFFVGSQVILAKMGFDIRWIACFVASIFFCIGILIFLDWKYKNEFKLHASLQHLLGEAIAHYCNDLINKVMTGFRVLGSSKNIFFAIVITLLYWAINLFGLAISFYAFHLPVSWEKIVVLLLATCFGTAIPAAPGYIGTFDYFSKMALVLYGVDQSVAASFAIATHFMSLVPFTLLGILFVYPAMSRLVKSPKAKSG
ncbi:MAG: hypothetical protein A3F13_05020 [Gammaproteobacteria bacterium RIFCSPHIGHO2_12_FULL_40_19]|nr:MAG: hypothetical protein A3F13_05020 [Gammaproteobacteria bacterium RIFCSPHIGHO2_12_FULL_40_19]